MTAAIREQAMRSQMPMHLAAAEPVVIEVVEAGVRELGIECPQLCQVKRKLGSVVHAGQEPDQSAGLPGGRISADRVLDHP